MRKLYYDTNTDGENFGVRLRDGLLPQSCYLCGDDSHFAVCEACSQSLARVPLEACPRCQLPTPTAQVCGRCIRRAPKWGRLYVHWQYEFPFDRIVLALKYGARFPLLDWAVSQLEAWPFTADAVLLPVPLTECRLRSRGYNQSWLLAHALADRFALRIDQNALIRIRETQPQQGLGLASRRRNVQAAFAATRSLQGQWIVLIDDVLTSGATLNELARVVYAAGAVRVDCFALARGVPVRRRERVLKFNKLST